MPASYCLDISNIGAHIGSEPDAELIRICLPFMNIARRIGNLTEQTWPPEVLRNAEDGAPLLSPDGTPLFVAG